MTTTVSLRLPADLLRRLDREAGTLGRSEFLRRLIQKETREARSAGWPTHFDRLQHQGRRIEGHPDDDVRRLNR